MANYKCKFCKQIISDYENWRYKGKCESCNKLIKMESEIKNAIIDNVFLGIEDHGIFTFIITFDYGGTSQSFVGGNLEGKNGIKSLRKIMEVFEINEWGNLQGEHARVKGTRNNIEEIGHIIKDQWYKP